MADPIRLPNSTSKGLSNAKITRTSRQRFENRQKRQHRRNDMQHPSSRGRARASVNRDDPDPSGRRSQDKKVVKRATQNRSANSPDGDQGNLIDICV